MLQVEGLHKTFELRLAQEMKVNPITNVSFRVETGHFLGIAGPSGIGKSSILKCIYRTYLPTSGSIRYESEAFGPVDLATASERDISFLRKREMGYVSQFLRVIPRVPAEDVVAERLLPFGRTLEQARSEARRMLERLLIPKRLWQAYPATFSGGEQQRINLARAFVAAPRLLILDEPTASLDAETKRSVLSLLRELKGSGTTMVGVFHDWDVMTEIADGIFDLQQHIREAVLQ